MPARNDNSAGPSNATQVCRADRSSQLQHPSRGHLGVQKATAIRSTYAHSLRYHSGIACMPQLPASCTHPLRAPQAAAPHLFRGALSLPHAQCWQHTSSGKLSLKVSHCSLQRAASGLGCDHVLGPHPLVELSIGAVAQGQGGLLQSGPLLVSLQHVRGRCSEESFSLDSCYKLVAAQQGGEGRSGPLQVGPLQVAQAQPGTQLENMLYSLCPFMLNSTVLRNATPSLRHTQQLRLFADRELKMHFPLVSKGSPPSWRWPPPCRSRSCCSGR